MKYSNNRRLNAAKRALELAAERVAFLESLPEEPPVDDDGSVVVYFTKKFTEGGITYNYAAVKAGNGFWYVTGPLAPQGVSWDELIDWIYDGAEADVYVATDFQLID